MTGGAEDEVEKNVLELGDEIIDQYNKGGDAVNNEGQPYIKKEDIPLFEEAYRRDGKAGLLKAVPDSYVEGMTASGTPEEAKARVQLYRDAGVKLPILRPAALGKPGNQHHGAVLYVGNGHSGRRVELALASGVVSLWIFI